MTADASNLPTTPVPSLEDLAVVVALVEQGERFVIALPDGHVAALVPVAWMEEAERAMARAGAAEPE